MFSFSLDTDLYLYLEGFSLDRGGLCMIKLAVVKLTLRKFHFSAALISPSSLQLNRKGLKQRNRVCDNIKKTMNIRMGER